MLIPDGVSEEQALLMTDALATAWFGARSPDILPRSSVAVIGLGPIGLMVIESASIMGAHIAYAIDPVAERRVLAEEAGAIALFGRDETVDLALRLVRARDTVSVIGVQQSRRYAFPLERFLQRA